MQKRASLARWAARFIRAVLIFPLLAAGLGLSVSLAVGVDRGSVESADQVAADGCVEQLRSPGDRPLRVCRERVN